MLIPELMDDPQLDPGEHLRALQGLRRINAWTRNASLIWRPIRQLARQSARRRLRVLDVATGSADIPIGLWRRARASGVELAIEACDVSERALQYAAVQCAQANAPVQLFQHDILRDRIPATYDFVVCSQFLHHLSDQQVTDVLVKMAGAAMHRVVAVDLVRNRRNWLQVWLATRVLSRSRVVHFDGPQSVRAALTPDELAALSAPSGLQSPRITTHWPCRMMLVGRPDRGHDAVRGAGDSEADDSEVDDSGEDDSGAGLANRKASGSAPARSDQTGSQQAGPNHDAEP